jgi:uncharacterized protein YjiS (DUF1127 family)
MSAYDDRALRYLGSAGTAAERAASPRGSSAVADARGIVARALGLVGAILRRIHMVQKARIGRRQLQAMSDWQLKDIGISRCEIERWAGTHPARARRSGHAAD